MHATRDYLVHPDDVLRFEREMSCQPIPDERLPDGTILRWPRHLVCLGVEVLDRTKMQAPGAVDINDVVEMVRVRCHFSDGA